GQQLYLPAARTNILRMAEKRKTDPIAHDAFLLETEQTQPVADAPGGVKSCWTHESAVTAARHPPRQRPQGQRIEAAHPETTTVTEDALAFPQQTMRLIGQIQSVGQQHGIHTAAGNGQVVSVEDDIIRSLRPARQPPLAQCTGLAKQICIETPGANLQQAETGQPGELLMQQLLLAFQQQLCARAGEPFRKLFFPLCIV